MEKALVPDYALAYNVFEIGLWFVCGIVMLAAARRATGAARLRSGLAASAFVLFALSDAAELKTGAWWRPPGLLVWKALCVIALMVLYLLHLRARRRGGTGPQ